MLYKSVNFHSRLCETVPTYLYDRKSSYSRQRLVRDANREHLVDPVLNQVHAYLGESYAPHSFFRRQVLFQPKGADQESNMEQDRVFCDQWGEEF
jgi:hypothetical protein